MTDFTANKILLASKFNGVMPEQLVHTDGFLQRHV